MKTGVYQIRNLTNGKRYVGSTASQKGFADRWSLHRLQLRREKHHSIKLQRAWNKHGADVFIFEVLLYCDPQDCLVYEQIALDHYKPEYNVAKIAGSSLGIKRSEAFKAGRRGNKNPMHGRDFRGEKGPNSKLTDAQRSEIQRLGLTGLSQRKRAAMFGVNRRTIGRIDQLTCL